MDEYHKLNVNWKKPDKKEYIVYNSIHKRFKNRQHYSKLLEIGQYCSWQRKSLAVKRALCSAFLPECWYKMWAIREKFIKLYTFWMFNIFWENCF